MIPATSERQKVQTTGSAGPARLIFWEVTKGCNLRCIHCRATATELLPDRSAHQPRSCHH